MVASGASMSPTPASAWPPSTFRYVLDSPSGVVTTFWIFAVWVPAACLNASLAFSASVTSLAHSSDRNFRAMSPPRGWSVRRISRGATIRSTRRCSAAGPHLLGERPDVVEGPDASSGQRGQRGGERASGNVRRHPALVPTEDRGRLGHAHHGGDGLDEQRCLGMRLAKPLDAPVAGGSLDCRLRIGDAPPSVGALAEREPSLPCHASALRAFHTCSAGHRRAHSRDTQPS